MPYRMAALVDPLARMASAEMMPALAALCEAACRNTAMATALVLQGAHPSVAYHLARHWALEGYTVPPEVRGMHPGMAAMVAMPGITALFPDLATAGWAVRMMPRMPWERPLELEVLAPGVMDP